MGGSKENGDKDDTEERNAAQSFISFSSEKEMKEPCPSPLLSLGDAMMNPDPNPGQLYKQIDMNVQ